LNGLVSRGFLMGADLKFLESENPLTDLMQGIIRVHSYITPPVPRATCKITNSTPSKNTNLHNLMV